MTAQEYFERGKKLFSEGRYEEALLAFEDAIQRDENYAAPWNGKGKVYNEIKNDQQALHCFEQAIQRDENDAASWNGKGIIYRILKNYQQALLCFEQAIQRDENGAVPWNSKGNVYYEIYSSEIGMRTPK